jgi:hypothetical protein
VVVPGSVLLVGFRYRDGDCRLSLQIITVVLSSSFTKPLGATQGASSTIAAVKALVTRTAEALPVDASLSTWLNAVSAEFADNQLRPDFPLAGMASFDLVSAVVLWRDWVGD